MSSTEALAARYGPAYRWIATVTALIAAIAVILSATIVNVAIPDIMGAFGIEPGRGAVAFDRLSRGHDRDHAAHRLDGAGVRPAQHASWRRSRCSWAARSSAASPRTRPSSSPRACCRERLAGIVQPLAMIIVFQVFPPDRRGSAMGIFGIGVVLAPALGPWVGGLLMDSFNWRYVFYLGVPFAAVGMALASVFLPTRNGTGPRPGFDWLGFALLCLFLSTLLSALSNGQRWGWSSDPILLQLALAAIAATAFVAGSG